MRDSNFIMNDGRRIPVSKLSIAEINDLLQSQLVVIDPLPGETVATVIDRLQIELIIRSLS